MLTQRLKRMLRRCVVKIDENTIELKERKGILFKFAFIVVAIASFYVDFIEPTYRCNTWGELTVYFPARDQISKKLGILSRSLQSRI